MSRSLTLLFSRLGQEGDPRIPIWIPNVKQRIAILRRVVKAKMFQNKLRKVKGNDTKRLRFFFNGCELQDDYTVEDYDLQEGNVIQVKVDQEKCQKIDLNPDEMHQEEVTVDPAQSKHQLSKIPDNQPTITSDLFYSLHDHIDALDDASGAWFPAQIASFCISTDSMDTTYLVTYHKPSLGSLICRNLTQIRPQSYQQMTFTDLYPSQSVLVLIDKLWYVALIERIHQDYRYSRVSSGKIWLNLVRGELGQFGTVLEQQVIKYKRENILKLEQNVPRIERDSELEEVIKNGCQTKRFYDPDCTICLDDIKVSSCSTCGCQVCSSKDSPESQLLCDECDRSTHIWCLQIPLDTLPSDPDWYCDLCRNPSDLELSQLRRDHLNTKSSAKRHLVLGKSTKSAGYGMSFAGRKTGSKTVPVGIFGSVGGVPVGSWWRFRAQAAECSVHCPLVSGIHGKANIGAYSIIYSGTYPEDVDLGDDLYYTATGGRESAKSRTNSTLVKDQELTKVNKALALNCAATFTGLGANSGSHWRTGRPVRVLRSGNGRSSSRSSTYLPKIGVRYDGLYKVVKYWKEEQSGLVIWRFHLRRDDPSPAPWTEAGRYQAKKNGYLTPRYPDGWSLEMAGKRQLTLDLKYIEKQKVTKKVKIVENFQFEKPNSFQIPDSILSLINKDLPNAKQWTELLNLAKDKGKTAFFSHLSETFLCICCMDQLFQEPVTLSGCNHSFCRQCLSRAITESELDHCPMCRSTPLTTGLNKVPTLITNHILEQILVQMSKIQ